MTDNFGRDVCLASFLSRMGKIVAKEKRTNGDPEQKRKRIDPHRLED
jgi:hypothetical protein